MKHRGVVKGRSVACVLVGRYVALVLVLLCSCTMVLMGSGCSSSRRGAEQNYAIRGKGVFRPAGCGCKKGKRKNLHQWGSDASGVIRAPKSGAYVRPDVVSN